MTITQTMRWFGPSDPVPLHAIRQAGATGIVTALHQVANGYIWTMDAIATRRRVIEDAGLAWKVVESLPVAEALKTRSSDWDRLIEAYIASLRNLAGQGIEVVTYNFMPLLDWTRTDLSWEMPDGARALRFELYALATYGNAGWLREQVCKYMCPYARFQSVMFDKDTLVVTYDAARGEQRNARMVMEGSGDCIDCSMCVQVCPTGIDIRKGLQYECIGCAACVDACNGVMDKVKRPRGLIRYATENALASRLTPSEVRRRVLRPRVMVYSAVLAILGAAMVASLALRNPLKLDVIRDRGSMGREVEDGMIENVYRLQVMNTTEQPQRLRITGDGIATARVAGEDMIAIDAATTQAVPVRIRIAGGDGKPGSNRIAITLAARDGTAMRVTEEAAFIVPK